MRVVLAGASGVIGRALGEALRARGDDVLALVRHEPGGGEARWDPSRHELDPRLLDGADAVVCLSGAGVGDKRWTESYKRTILASRVDSVGTLARTMAEAGGPSVLVAASAIGYYGDTGDRAVDETAPAGDSFLAGVCVDWEAAAAPAVQAGIRVAHPRTALVLTTSGGLLQRLKPIVQLGVAGRLGSGRQYFPWITLADEVGAIVHLLDTDVSGPANLTAAQQVTNAEFMHTLGRVLHRPTIFPTPGFALRIVLGEFAGETLAGQRAVPRVLEQTGFAYQHPELEAGLRWALEH